MGENWVDIKLLLATELVFLRSQVSDGRCQEHPAGGWLAAKLTTMHRVNIEHCLI
jgi:hypothetical protein